MRVQVKAGLEGAESLTGCVVILDIIRASNTILSALTAGATAVHLVAELDQARALKAANPAWAMWGERGGVRVEGFEGDNSPAKALASPLAGQTVVLSTSNGTRALQMLTQAQSVFIGSLGNASALVEAIRSLQPQVVNLLAVGSAHEFGAPEDRLVAGYIKEMLEGGQPDLSQARRDFLALPSAELLIELEQEDDRELCSRPDYSRVVPVVSYQPHAVATAWVG